MSGKGDQVLLKPEGFSARSNEGKLNDNIPHGGKKKTSPKMEMASQCPRAASLKTLSTWHKPASPTEGESGRKQRRVRAEREEGRERKVGGENNSCPPLPTPEIGFILNQNKSLSHKSQQLRLNLSRNCDEIYCGRWEKKKRIISGEALVSRWAEYSWHLSRVLGL